MQINNIFNKILHPFILLSFILVTTNLFSSTSVLNSSSDDEKAYKTKHISIRIFEKDLDQIYKNINRKSFFNANNCDEYIEKITNFLLIESGKRYLPLSQRDFRRLEKRGDIILQKLFLLRLQLRKKFKEFYMQGKVTSDCVKKIRMAFRYSRFIEEFITEILVDIDQKPTIANEENFSQKKYQFYLNPKYKNFHLKSGDILLVRSPVFVSAVISRIGDEDGQLSHGAMIYVDNKGKAYVMEALIKSGTIITPYEEWRKINHHSRSLLFRHNDEILAKESALKIYKMINDRTAADNFIPYDFTMNDSNNSEIFCAELIQYAFKLSGDDRIPTFRTSFKSFHNHTFLNELSVSKEDVFSPGDLEIEPYINLVAEWRNYDLTRQARLQDVIQTKILYWMSEKDYYLKNTFKSIIGTNFVLLASRLGFMRDTIPLNMPYGFIDNIIKMSTLNSILENYLMDLEKKYLKKHGHSMDYLTMLKEMEKLRIRDCESFILREKEMKQKRYDIETLSEPYQSSKPIFHDIFNTKNGFDCKK